MSIQWIDLILLLIIALTCYSGFKKGFLLTIFRMVSFLLSIWIAWISHPLIKNFLLKYTKLLEIIKKSVYDMLIKLGPESGISESVEMQNSFIGKLNIPQLFKIDLTSTKTGGEYADTFDFLGSLAEGIASIVLSIITVILVIIVVTIIISSLRGLIKIIGEIPIIYSVNKVLGIVVGFFIGILQIWLVFSILTIFSTNEAMEGFFTMLHSSTISNYLYENNLIHFMIMGIFS